MARNWPGILFPFLMVVCFSRAEATTNLRCAILKDVFPTCPCYRADEEKGSVYAIVDCSNKSLTRVPTIQKSYNEIIYKLILKGNNINSLTDNSFQGLRVEYLDLSGNNLSSVENDTFLSMQDSLRILEIDGDSNSIPPINALKKLKILESLNLRNYNVRFMDRQYFLSFTKLKSLTLDNWKTEHIENGAFLGLQKLRNLALLNQKLSNLPLGPLSDDPLPELETLTISHTQITEVTHSAFRKLTNLKNLDLSNNQINSLEENCFSSIEDTLENVNLHKNLLNNDNDKVAGLSGLTVLKKLDLSHNTFKRIPSMSNLGPTKPFDLLLSDNEINEVQENAFRGYAQNLNLLDLNGNYIRSMSSKSFIGVTQLTSFHLRDQKGPSSDPILLPISLTDSALTLETVHITGQRVDPNYLWPVISNLTLLKELNLKSSELTKVPDFSFRDLNALEQLDLSFNRLSELTQKSLVGLRSLKTLDLEGNVIQTIPSCLFYGVEYSIITLNLGANPIICDCKIKQLLTDVVNGSIEFDTASPPKCSDGDLLTSKNPDDFVCSPPSGSVTTPVPTTAGSVTTPQIEITNSSSVGGKDSGSDTGIAVGCVVGGVALICVIVEILILLVVRKKPKTIQDNNNRTPMPPRHFEKAELPTMTEDTRRFRKVEKNGKGPQKKGMQVVAISDGQTSHGARVGRANLMFEPEEGYEPMDNFKKKNYGGSIYENDHGALPPTPGQNSLPPSYPGSGYYNQAFRDDKYEQIEVEL